jgi:hypothetical protein
MMKRRLTSMTKEEAIKLMISKVEELERDRLSQQADATKQKQEIVEAIVKAVKGVAIENAD